MFANLSPAPGPLQFAPNAPIEVTGAEGRQTGLGNRPWLRWLLAIGGLVALNGLIFGQTLSFPFITFDDDQYVLDNPALQAAPGARALVWAFSTFDAGNWHPLTWLSLLLDRQLYGLQPGGYHLTNVLLHAANSLLVLWWLWSMTGAFRRSLLVAALFAVHPLHVESVAWVAERKDVLSAFFFLLTLMTYGRYARRGGAGWYGASLGCYVLGLLAKPMLVTVPMLLLLLDWWPLRRFGKAPGGLSWRPGGARLLAEKVPFLALSLASCVVTFLAQRAGNAVVPLRNVSLWQRVPNTVLAYGEYLWKTFVPLDLSVFYPPVEGPHWGLLAASAVSLAALGWLVIVLRGRAPAVVVGLPWFGGMLVPVIGLVQVGAQRVADRYVYLPHLGLFLALVWGVADVSRRGGLGARRILSAAAVAAVLAATVLARAQAGAWRDSVTLYERSLAATGPNARLLQMLGDASLLRGNDLAKADHYYRAALELMPQEVHALKQMGTVRLLQGRWAEAVELLNPTLARLPTDFKNFNNYGRALQRLGGHDAAAREALEQSLRVRPDFAPAHLNLAELLIARGDWPGAVEHEERALASPGNPQPPDLLLRLAWVRATAALPALRDGARARELTRQAVERMGGHEIVSLDCMAAAAAELGRWPEAETAARSALEHAEEEFGPTSENAQRRRDWLALYLARQPLRLAEPVFKD